MPVVGKRSPHSQRGFSELTLQRHHSGQRNRLKPWRCLCPKRDDFARVAVSSSPPPVCSRRGAILAFALAVCCTHCQSPRRQLGYPGKEVLIDAAYPGTAVSRMNAIRARARSLTKEELSGEWEAVRRRLLWAAGLKDLPNALPGEGYTGHAFNDAIHVDATAMLGEVSENLNPTGAGRVSGIAVGNRLGPGIQIASIAELGAGGSWSTCQLDARRGSTDDVAHGQFQSRIAFKLVWCPPNLTPLFSWTTTAHCSPRALRGALPPLAERQANFEMVRGPSTPPTRNSTHLRVLRRARRLLFVARIPVVP